MIISKTKPGSYFLIGSSCITNKLKEEGYAYTICASVMTEDGSVDLQDLHCTEEQLRDLASLIENILEASPKIHVP